MPSDQTTRPCITHHHACDCREAAKRAGIGRRTLHRHFGPRGTPAFGKPRGRKPQ